MTEYLTRTDNFIAALGFEAYRVGGSVRDEILGRRCKDADYMVRGASLVDLRNALVKAADRKAITPLKLRDGRQFGWRVSAPGLGLIEIALPRTEVSTGPGRRDFDIVVDPELAVFEDAKRRDFTFNALYKLVPDGSVVDPTARGLYDLQHRLVTTTHPDSFRDDPLRTLRALRFVSVLGYDLSANTREEMERHADAVNGLTDKGVSGTALEELCKLLMGADVAKALRIARDTGVLGTLLPELEPMLGFDQSSRYHDSTVDEHTFLALETAAKVDAPLRVRMALLFHDSGKPLVAWKGKDGYNHFYAHKDLPFSLDHEDESERLWRSAAARLNAPRALREDVATLVKEHMLSPHARGSKAKVRARRLRVKFGDDMLADLILHCMCDTAGRKGRPNVKDMEGFALLEDARQRAKAAGYPSSAKDLAVNGKDMMDLGLAGKAIGAVLAAVLDEVVCTADLPTATREWQLDRARAHARKA